MSNNKFSDKFEQYTQCSYYVGIYRNKDVRTFNYLLDKESPNLVGISSFVDYIEIENSVDHAFRVGRVCIKDTIDMRKNFPIMGNEILYIEYNNVNTAKLSTSFSKKGFFRVVGIDESKDFTNQNSSTKTTSRHLTLYVAEYPYIDLLTFNNYNKTYSWNGGTLLTPPMGPKPISLMVSDMFLGPLNREKALTMGITFYADPTSDILPTDWLNYYSPSWSVLKNINFLKRLCTTLVGDYSYYYLNCEAGKVTFKSIYSEYLTPTRSFNKLSFVPIELSSLIPTFDISPDDPTNTLMDVNFKYGNSHDAMFSGLSGETFFTFDHLSGHSFNAYDYRMFKQLSSSNDLFYINYHKFGDQTSTSSYSPFTNPSINKNIKKYEYSKKSFNSMVCEAVTFVNNSRYLGQTADVLIGSSSKQTKELIDPILGENWCVWGYKDIISAQRGICKLTLKKDSTWVPYFGLGGSMLPFV